MGKITDLMLADNKARVIALGAFDGVHFAHRRVLSTAVDIAKARGITSAVFTFYSDPSAFFGKPQQLLNSQKQRFELICDTGIAEIIAAEFDEKMCSTEPEKFYTVLKEKLNPKCIVCGHNYTFGKLGKGDVKLLFDLCNKDGIDLIVIDKVCLDGIAVSSSLIRAFISAGKIIEANKLLGYSYTISGEITRGNSIGNQMGFPTANIILPQNTATPLYGVYATKIIAEGKEYSSVSNVGVKPTVGSDKPILESFIFDFDGNLYGKRITVKFIDFIREEKKFTNLKALAAQINEDIKAVKAYFNE